MWSLCNAVNVLPCFTEVYYILSSSMINISLFKLRHCIQYSCSSWPHSETRPYLRGNWACRPGGHYWDYRCCPGAPSLSEVHATHLMDPQLSCKDLTTWQVARLVASPMVSPWHHSPLPALTLIASYRHIPRSLHRRDWQDRPRTGSRSWPVAIMPS